MVGSNEDKLDGIGVDFAAKLKELCISFASITYDCSVDKVSGKSMASKWTTMATTTSDRQINEFLTELSDKRAAQDTSIFAFLVAHEEEVKHAKDIPREEAISALVVSKSGQA